MYPRISTSCRLVQRDAHAPDGRRRFAVKWRQLERNTYRCIAPIEQGPGRQRKLPAGFCKAGHGRARLTAPRKHVFGGFEDKLGADRVDWVEELNTVPLNRTAHLTSDLFVPRYAMGVKLNPPDPSVKSSGCSGILSVITKDLELERP